MQKLPVTLPSGLVVHCALCNLVVPADAPLLPSADCGFVALHKLSFFNPTETPAGQHIQAVATWGLIHDAALKVADHVATEYYTASQADRKKHFAASAVRLGMTEEQVAHASSHRRDGAFYK